MLPPAAVIYWLSIHRSRRVQVRELVTLAKSSSSPLTYSTAGAGNPQHFLGEFYNARADIHMIFT